MIPSLPRPQRTESQSSSGESPAKDNWPLGPLVGHKDFPLRRNFKDFTMLTTNCSPVQNAAILRRPVDSLFTGLTVGPGSQRDLQSMSASLTVPDPVATMSHIITRGPLSLGMPSVIGHSPHQRLGEGASYLINNQFGDGGFGLFSEKPDLFPEAYCSSGLGTLNSQASGATVEPFLVGESPTDFGIQE